TAQPLVPPLPHDQIVQNAVFSPDGRRVLTVSQDSLRRVWDLHREAAPPVLLRPLQPTGINEMALRGLVSVSKEMNNLIRVRSMLGGLDVPLHPISMKIVPMQAWLDETSHFVILEGEMAKAQVWDVASGLPITPLVRSQYTLNETAYRTVMLPSSRLSASDATDLAQLLSGSRLDGTGGWTPLKLEEITAAWERLTRNSKIQNPKSKIERRGREPAAHDALSLTPALSRWERESGRPRTEDSNASGVVKGPSAIPPLPAGEGRGEGERHATPEQSGTAQTAPAPFVGPSSVPLETWHEQEAKAAAGALDWFAAAFHWQQLARLHADHPEFALLRSYAEQCLAKARTTAKSYEELRRVIPPRDPRADAPLIDLSDHYTGAITEGFRVGMQKLGGVSFDVRGQIELFGLGAEARGHRHPEKVSGIKIQQRCARLHFLHSVEGGAYRTEGEPLATLVVAYANGQSEKLAIQNRVHAGGDRSGSEYAPKQAEAVWIGTNPFANSLQWSVWLYKYTWANPHPDWEISHIDLVSAKTEASYVLLAMSVE
ncbi:MAG: hypothetical protein HYY23_03615, partial [Verrucomicrobia bacterium]|nr:hypothetical protein [Verrucomicrobiota bacterium]